jgi:hypothetical protein
MAFLAAVILFSILLLDPSKPITLLFLLIIILSFIFILWKYQDRLLAKYQSTIVVTDDHFTINDYKYYWEDVTWHRTDFNSAVMHGFIIGYKSSKPIRLHTSNKSGVHYNNWKNMRADFLNMLHIKNIEVRNYYNSKLWRRTARLLLASNLLIPIILYIFLDISIVQVWPALLIWLGTSLSFSAVIFKNQNKNINL